MSVLTPYSPIPKSKSLGALVRELNLALNRREIFWREAIALPVRSITAARTPDGSDHTILADATSGAVTVTLPRANQFRGGRYNIVKVDSSANAVTIARSGTDTIDGQTSLSLSSQWNAVALQSDGTSSWVSLANGLTIGNATITGDLTVLGLRVGGGTLAVADNEIRLTPTGRSDGAKILHSGSGNYQLALTGTGQLQLLGGLSLTLGPSTGGTWTISSAGGNTTTGQILLTAAFASGTAALFISGTAGEGLLRIQGGGTNQGFIRFVDAGQYISLSVATYTNDDVKIANGGVVTFRSNVTCSAALNVVGAIVVTGAASFGGNTSCLSALNITGAMVCTGNATFGGTISLSTASGKIIPGATNLSHRNNADSADNLLIADNGDVTVRNKFKVNSVAGAVTANATLATSATVGFLYVPTSPGTATGVPAAETGTVALWFDTTNNRLQVYNGGLKTVLLA